MFKSEVFIMAKIFGDYHMRTVYNEDGYSTIAEYVSRAKELGYTEIAITDLCKKDLDHAQHFIGMTKHIPPYLQGVRVLKGIETNILPTGTVSTPFEILSKLEWVIASIHRDTDYQADCDYTRIIEKIVMQSRFNVKVLGHMHTIIDNENVTRIVKACKYAGVLVEVADYDIEMHVEAMQCLLQACLVNSVPIVMTSNAHHVMDMGDFSRVLHFLSEVRYPLSLVYNLKSHTKEHEVIFHTL